MIKAKGRLRIVSSSGRADDTKVYFGDEELLVRKMVFTVEAQQITEAVITCIAPNMEIEGDFIEVEREFVEGD